MPHMLASLIPKKHNQSRRAEPRLLAATLNNLSHSLLNMGDLRAAEFALKESIALIDNLRKNLTDMQRITVFDTQIYTYNLLSQVYVAQGNHEAALLASELGRARALAEVFNPEQSLTLADVEKIRDVVQALDATLVEYALLPEENFVVQGRQRGKSEAIYIWVVQPSGEITFRQVEITDDLAQMVSKNHSFLSASGRGFELISDAETSSSQLKSLHKLLIDPIADLLPDDPNQRVTFIPQGELFSVPFPALMDANGIYLVDRHTIITAPSIQVLDETRKRQQALGSQTPDSADNWLLVGNPTMPPVWNPKTNRAATLPSLHYAEVEAEAIGSRFSVKPLIGAEATEARIKQSISDADIIHLATHGLLEYGNPQESGVQDIPGAIALASSTDEDGLLTSAEIRELQLQANLVVLSACDTGLGDITGDGVIGLSRSLITAGIPSVIVSLWSVPDDSTSILMQEFYRQWQSGLDKAQALRQAMLFTKEQYPDPSSWASFTLIGEAN